MVGLVIHEHCIGSVIKEYTNLEATLSIPQYGFQKGMKVFKKGTQDHSKRTRQESHW